MFLLILTACNGGEEKSRKNPEVPDLSAIVERQAFLLDSLDAGAFKIVALNKESDTIPHVKVDWQEEFDIYKEADISDLRFSSLYEKIEESPGKYSLRLKEGVKEPVKFLNYEVRDNKIQEIEAKIKVDNLLYEREVWLRLEFSEMNGLWLISSYRIVSSTDVLLAGSRNYSVDANTILSKE